MTHKPNSKKEGEKPHATGAVPQEKAPANGAPEAGFPIVGIGASAGGLAAFEAFFSAMPADTVPGMAFVVVQHLSPDYKSILTELIKRYTRMQVFEVEDGMAVQPNCAYIIPPNRDLALVNGTLQLLEPGAPRGLRLPIDYFFRSMAEDQHEKTICIILSGTGSDGTLGVRSVKGEGGMVMVQQPESTEYDGMPRSAIATGMVDYILPPAEMPAQLLAFAAHAFGKAPLLVAPQPHKVEDAKNKIFTLLRVQTGHDFSHYKKNTIERRIERRMAVHQIERLEDYVHYLQQNPAEVEALFLDLLIGVTNFFRDPAAFETLRKQVIPRLFVNKPASTMIRVWVPGCSTGEEAYSIAILLQEYMEAIKQHFVVQVFATDIDSRAIERARAGIYPASIAADVSPERLARFFAQEPDHTSYRIQKNIRDLLVFSEQDLIKDPPFSKLDLVSCRNLLIYMDGDLQKKLTPLFHYSLNPGGFLFLGTSESVGDFVDLFSTLDSKAKLYQRKDDAHRARSLAVGRFLPAAHERSTQRPAGKATGNKTPLRELTERTLLQEYASAGVLVNERGDILYLHGRSGDYLEPSPGEAGMNILKMAREGLRRDLTIALHKAVAQGEPIRHPALRIKTNSHFTTVNLIVRPVGGEPNPTAESALFLVILEKAPDAPLEKALAEAAEAEKTRGPQDVDTRIIELKQELRAKEEYLHSTNEELETSNEELKSSNEEMQSMNEELQSTNEELETSKEELQSVNEELATVNAELQTKVSDLSRANNDMNNLLAGTGMGTVFVDHHLRIQRFTPAVTQVINLILTDVGRPVGHIVSNLVGYNRLVEDVQSVLNTLIPKEIEVQTKAGAWYLLGIRPYRTLENVIEGAVINFVDITEMKKAQNVLQDSEVLRRLAVVVRDSRDAILVQDMEGHILGWNPGAERMYGWSEAEALHMNIRDMIPEDRRAGALETTKQLSKTGEMKPYRMQRLTKDGRTVEVWINASPLIHKTDEVYAIATTERFVKD